MEGAPLLDRRPGRGGSMAEQARAAAAGRRQVGSRRQSRLGLVPVAAGQPGQIGRRVSVLTPPGREPSRARTLPSPAGSSESFLLGEPREAPARGTTNPLPGQTRGSRGDYPAGGKERRLPSG